MPVEPARDAPGDRDPRLQLLELVLVVRAGADRSDEVRRLVARVAEQAARELDVDPPRVRTVSEARGDEVVLRAVASGPGEAGEARPVLTARQREVLRLLDRGLLTKQIAAELGISQYTVNNHIQAILRALNAVSRTSALHRARLLHLL